MKKDMIFFATEGPGLTSTSANHIANMAKEMVRGIKSWLDGLVLYSTSVALIGSDSDKTLTLGATAADLESVPGKLRTLAKANSLIAWLREAIKARERLLAENEEYSLQDYCRDRDIKYPELPAMGRALTPDEYYGSLSMAERNRYLELETQAAVIGWAIHPGGSLADARQALTEHIQAPNEVKGDGRDTLIYSYRPTVSTEAVDEVYFALQKLHRETQAALNSMKFACEQAVKESELAVKTEYVNASKTYSERMEVLRAELTRYRTERARAIGNYRIVIPESLRSIYDEVSQLGKK